MSRPSRPVGRHSRWRLLRMRILLTFTPIEPTRQSLSPEEFSVPPPDRAVLQDLIAEQFKRPKPRWLPRLTNYDPTVLDVIPVADGGFFQKHSLLEVHVEGSFLEGRPRPGHTSFGLFAWDGIDLRYLNRRYPQNFELVLRTEARLLNGADPYVLAAIAAEAVLAAGNDTHVV